MKVLVIDEWLPWPLENGKKIRTFNLIARLAKRHEILYMAYARLPEEKDKVGVFERLGIRVVPVMDIRILKWTFPFYMAVFKNLFSKEPFSTAYHVKNTFSEKMIETIELEQPDLVHCEWSNLAPFLKHVQWIPKVISAHNVESHIWRRLKRHSRNPLKRLIGRQQAKRIERLEMEWYPKVERCIAVTRNDQEVIEGYGANVSLVENGVNVEHYDVKPFEEDGERLIYTASFETFSNQDAVDYFVAEIFPLLKTQRPKIGFWIVGKDPPRRFLNYAANDRRVHVTGTVPDVREHISKSSICVIPLRIGGGSRLKILEALAMKKAVISTSVGAEGLRVRDGKHLLMADHPRDFAAKVLRLFKDPDERRSLGLAGYELVKSTYDWRELAEKQHDIWASVVGKRKDGTLLGIKDSG
jgi:glycosyltransferase involved in cell wall biosynthesis